MLNRMFYAPDTGADGAGEPAGAEPTAPGADALESVGSVVKETPPADPKPQEPPALPKYSSQLSPEIREKYKESLEKMGKDTSLNDTFSELMETRGKLERAILLPEKDNPEDIKRFMQDMGIPESPDGYKIDEKVLGAEATKLMTQQALKAGMTTKQAQAMHGFIVALVKNGQAGIAQATAVRS